MSDRAGRPAERQTMLTRMEHWMLCKLLARWGRREDRHEIEERRIASAFMAAVHATELTTRR